MGKSSGSSLKKKITLAIVAGVLAIILIVGNILLNQWSSILHTLFLSLTGGYSTEKGEAYEIGDALVAQLVEDSAVLLRNENNALPLDPNNDSENKVNLFSWNATTAGFLLTGTGSGGSPILDENRVTLAEAFVEAGYQYNEALLNAYATESGAGNDTINKAGQFADSAMRAIYNPGESFYSVERMNEARAYSDVAIIVLSRNTGENVNVNETLNSNGYSNGSWLELTDKEKIMLQKVTETFADGKVIVLLNTTNTMELGFLEDYEVDAAMYVGPVGQSGARAIPHLLYGQKVVKDKDGNEEIVQVSPSGRTSDTYAYNYNPVDGISYSASWSSAISNGNSIYYQEGIYLGYKWYETANAEGFFANADTHYGFGYDGIVQYPFGYGLSYTQFKWTIEQWPENGKLTADGEYEVKVRVENIGTVPGKDVVELYYTPPYYNGKIEKSSINLLAFGKTITLEPGQAQVVTLSFTAYDLASYDDYDKNGNGFAGYELDEGAHELKLMRDSHYAAICYDNYSNEVSNVHEMSCDGIQFAYDPVTNTKVENQFTGSNAYSGTPIDGSTVFNGGINYLSRKDGFANFPQTTSYQCAALNSKPSKTYQTNEWDYADTSNFQYGQDNGLYLVTKKSGDRATLADLDNINDLEFNVDLMTVLWDYDSEVWDFFLDQMTMKEMTNLIGEGNFQTIAIESIGKPNCRELDGPAGFNQNSVAGATSDPGWVVFPAEILLGCSWNPQSTYQMGKAMGIIANDTGVHGWYGPGLNLHRSPYYGRNFEYYSEDAVLTGKLVAECVRGAKEYNLTCYMKHFVCADTGPNSRDWYTWLTEQNLRENYLRPFEIAVKEGKANAIMSGFSDVGATWAGSNYALSTQILRNEWGFRGSMITDWYNNYMDPIRGITGGNDLWLGKVTVNANTVAATYCVRQSAKNILYTYVDCYMTAYEYANDPNKDDGYNVDISNVSGSGKAYSPLFAALWVIIDILLVAGIAVCVLFIFLPKKKNEQPAIEQSNE